jgi:DNA primase
MVTIPNSSPPSEHSTISAKPTEIVLAFDPDQGGQSGVWRTLERHYGLKQPPIWASKPDWAIEAEIEHIDRLLPAAEPGGVAEGMLLDERRELLFELDRRHKQSYRKAQSPFDWPSLLDAIKHRADVLSVFGSRGVGLDSKGRDTQRRVKALCPFHAEKHPSLTIYVDQQTWRCFGCGRGGDVVDAVELLDGLEFVPACLRLCQEFGVDLPRTSAGVAVPRL